jgi:hypothetical protein
LDDWKDSTNRKFQRITESGAIRIAAIPLVVDSLYLLKPTIENAKQAYEPQPMPEVLNLDIYASESILEEFCNHLNNDAERNATIKVITSLKDAFYHGKTLFELKAFCYEESMSDDGAYNLLKCLENSHMIFNCGIDTLRYVHIRHALDWGLDIDGKAVFVKPWTNDDGTIDYSTFRWMSEMVFVTINESPDITLTNLKSFFSNVIHPVFIVDIVEFLSRVKIIKIEVDEIPRIVFKNPFEREEVPEYETSLRAVFNGVDLFALIFKGIDIPEFARQKLQQSQSSQSVQEPTESYEENDEEAGLDDSMF